jgi:hypothetical protein
MTRSRNYNVSYDADELGVFRRAYEDACSQLGVNPHSLDDDSKGKRDAVAGAIMIAAKFGERDPVALASYAIAVAIAAPRGPKSPADRQKRDNLIGRLDLLKSGKIAVFRAQYGRPVDFTAEDIRALEEQLGEIDDLPAKDS